jgi:hypothetical protein
MKRIATIVVVHGAGRFGYKWRWRAQDCGALSERTFDLFYQCLQDAEANGYDVTLPPPPRDLMASGLPHDPP